MRRLWSAHPTYSALANSPNRTALAPCKPNCNVNLAARKLAAAGVGSPLRNARTAGQYYSAMTRARGTPMLATDLWIRGGLEVPCSSSTNEAKETRNFQQKISLPVPNYSALSRATATQCRQMAEADHHPYCPVVLCEVRPREASNPDCESQDKGLAAARGTELVNWILRAHVLGKVHEGLHDGPVLLGGVDARVAPAPHRQVLPRPAAQTSSLLRHASFQLPANEGSATTGIFRSPLVRVQPGCTRHGDMRACLL